MISTSYLINFQVSAKAVDHQDDRPARGPCRGAMMTARNINNLETEPAGESKAEPVVAVEAKAPPEARPVRVMLHYPEPTMVAQILRDVAKWSGQCFVMEPGLNRPLQIFAPQPLPPERAYLMLINSLSVVQLRAVELETIVKIVPIQTIVTA